MSRHTTPATGQTQPVVAIVLGLIAIAGLVLVVAFGPGRTDAPAPVASPSPSAPAPTTPAPSAPAASTPAATPSPSAEPGVTKVDLDIADDHDVVAAVQDRDGIIASVKSGRASDGMSVRWHKVLVENVDDTTIRFTWVGLPGDEQVDISIVEREGGIAVTFVQAGPYANTDALGSDRVLVVEFESGVDAADVDTEVLDRSVD